MVEIGTVCLYVMLICCRTVLETLFFRRILGSVTVERIIMDMSQVKEYIISSLIMERIIMDRSQVTEYIIPFLTMKRIVMDRSQVND